MVVTLHSLSERYLKHPPHVRPQRAVCRFLILVIEYRFSETYNGV